MWRWCCREVFDVFDLHFWPFSCKLAHQLLQLWRTFTSIFNFFFTPFCVFQLGARAGQTDRRTDGRTGMTARLVKRLIRTLNLGNLYWLQSQKIVRGTSVVYSAVLGDMRTRQHVGWRLWNYTALGLRRLTNIICVSRVCVFSGENRLSSDQPSRLKTC